MTAFSKGAFVYLAYIDDSDTRLKSSAWKVLCGVILKDSNLNLTEILMASIAEALLPEEKLEDFKEFHACELYGGHGCFEGIDQTKRFEAIKDLLQLVIDYDMAVVYGAVDTKQLVHHLFGSADPVDIAFRICAHGIEKFVRESFKKPPPLDPDAYQMAMLIADDCDGKTKATMQRSFRTLRKRMRPPDYGGGQLTLVHDDMYFGSSTYSIGIQLADLCAYFIARHLGGDVETAGFYGMIEKRILYSRTEPQTEQDESKTITIPGI